MFKNRKILVPTPEEDVAINRGIAADPDTFEPSIEEIQQMKPLGERAKKMGRPKSSNPKEAVTVRYDAEVIAAFRSSGDGWQTRMNDVLLTFVRKQWIDPVATWETFESAFVDAKRLSHLVSTLDLKHYALNTEFDVTTKAFDTFTPKEFDSLVRNTSTESTLDGKSLAVIALTVGAETLPVRVLYDKRSYKNSEVLIDQLRSELH